MSLKNIPPDDSFAIRCPKLGQQIAFSYCRQENMGLPCSRTQDCWFTHFDVVVYLRQELTPAQWQQSFETPPAPKMVSLAELIEKALKIKKEKN